MITKLGMWWFRMTAWGPGVIHPPHYKAARFTVKSSPPADGWNPPPLGSAVTR